MDLISTYNNNIILYRDGKLISRSTTVRDREEVDVPKEIVFVSKNYLVDSEKTFFVFENSTVQNAFKLRRNIFSLLEHNGVTYIADKFGDVYRVHGEGYEYVLGTLSYLTGMVIHNKNILLSDKYGRIGISTLDRRIIDYRYDPEPIVSLICVRNSLVAVSNRQVSLHDDEEYVRSSVFEFPEGVEVVKRIDKGENEFVVICLSSHFLFRVGERIELLSCVEEPIIDGVSSGSKFNKVKADYTVVDDSNGEVFI